MARRHKNTTTDDINWGELTPAIDAPTLARLCAEWADIAAVRAGLRAAAVQAGALDSLVALCDAAEVRLSEGAMHRQGMLERECCDWAGWLDQTLSAGIERHRDDPTTQARLAYVTCGIVLAAMDMIDDSYGAAGDVFDDALGQWLRAECATDAAPDAVLDRLEAMVGTDRYGLFYGASRRLKRPEGATDSFWQRVQQILDRS